ncbi:unnamed protein product [Meganyctiphanes norvegica]|uniref:Uncharacterized protein n=1 Tax=Meganyctiphanes norvegica TaxID=48144 RepID=A0AAV2QP87_MEGNR
MVKYCKDFFVKKKTALNERYSKCMWKSSDENGEKKCIQNKDNLTASLNPTFHPKNGDFVVCKYNHLKWIGFVDSQDDKFEYFGINFLFPSGYCKYNFFPEKKDFCYVIKENILGILTSHNLKSWYKSHSI